jgi:LDH2 family malate/lactate/ureidoglycolate dehydrogenase
MNTPPREAIRVPPEPLRAFVAALFQKVGLNEEDAGLLARLLVLNDLRGVFSHGTRQVTGYVHHFRAGELNPRPSVTVMADHGSTMLLDGDGGLGYFPCWRGAHLLVERCRAHGVAAVVTRNHGHFGAAGLYSRVPVKAGQIAYVTSGHHLRLAPDHSVRAIAGGSPMSFGVPAGEEPPLVLDFGAIHDLDHDGPFVETAIREAPGLVFRSIGLGSVCQSLGGFLAGVPFGSDDPAAEHMERWSGANQGSLMIALAVERFLDPAIFSGRMDAYARRTRELEPLPGFDRATLAGGLEWERSQEWSKTGIPVGKRHQEALTRVGEMLGIAPPF